MITPACVRPAAPAFALFHQIRVFRMLVDIAGDEGALRHYLQAMRSRDLQQAARQLRTDALAAKFLRNLGVYDGDRAPARLYSENAMCPSASSSKRWRCVLSRTSLGMGTNKCAQAF